MIGLNFLSKQANLQPGQKVYTSGVGGVFPSGVLIGAVKEFKVRELDGYATLVPAVDLSSSKMSSSSSAIPNDLLRHPSRGMFVGAGPAAFHRAAAGHRRAGLLMPMIMFYGALALPLPGCSRWPFAAG